MHRVDRFFQRIERRPHHPAALFLIVLIVGIGRTAEEVYFGHLSVPLNALSHNAAFYLASFFGFAAIAAILLRQEWKKTAQVVVLGVLAGLIPPLIDLFWLGPGQFRYSYLDRFYPTLHGGGNPYSEAITGWSALGAFALYIYVRSRSWWRSLFGLGLGYLYLILMATTYPVLITTLFAPIKGGVVRCLFYLLLCYGLYVGFNFQRFWPSLKRINHTLPWVVLVFLGASLAGGIQKMTWLQGLLVLFVHQGIIFANDYYDRDSDELNQRTSRLDQNDILMIHGLIVWLALHFCLVRSELGLLYLLYILLTTSYHHPALKLKQIFPLNYLLEGLVAALALLIGMASVDRTTLNAPELLYLGLAFAGFAGASPFKDYKDLDGDRMTGTRTLYILLAERGWSLEKAHKWIMVVLLGFLAVPLLLLYCKGITLSLGLLIPPLFLVPVFLSLRSANKTAAVERTVWILIVYLAALVLVLNFAKAPPDKRILKDYGGLYSGAEIYASAHPASLEEVVAIVLKANRNRTPIRIRGNGHSMNGVSLPRTNELVIFTDQMRHYRFEEPGSITVGAGIRMYELSIFLGGKGYTLPVTNGGEGGPSVGGFLAGGGVGAGSAQYGGFWENVFEITLVTGDGEVLRLRPGDELFPWMFGSMGQLGIIVSAKLKIVGSEAASYPSNEQGMIPPQELEVSGRFYWFGIFAPMEEFEAVRAVLQRIKMAHQGAIRYRRDTIYRMPFSRFNPKLIFPPQRDFVGVEIWGEPKSTDLEPVLALERDIAELVRTHREIPYRRYIQVELVAPETNYEAYFGADLYNEFLALKKRLDPNLLLNCGTVFPCGGQLRQERRTMVPGSSRKSSATTGTVRVTPGPKPDSD